MRMISSVIILLVLIFSPAILLFVQSAQSETGIQLARSQAAIVGDIQHDISGSSSGSSSYSSSSGTSGSMSTMGSSHSSMGEINGHTVEYQRINGELKVVFPKISPNPLRYSCAEIWNSYYKKENVNIKVSTRGHYSESVVFFCPTCYNEEHFVKPFLESEYEGMTGMDRIKSCGYEYAIFRGGRGLNEVVIDVPDDEMHEISYEELEDTENN